MAGRCSAFPNVPRRWLRCLRAWWLVSRIGQQLSRIVPSTAGELWIAGPMVVPGYWQRADANQSEFIDGFWRSGDVGSIDPDGFVRLFDRKKDMI